MIQRTIIIMLAMIIAGGCASLRKTVDVSIGTWDYVIAIDPPDELTGWLTFAKEGDTYVGTINSDE